MAETADSMDAVPDAAHEWRGAGRSDAPSNHLLQSGRTAWPDLSSGDCAYLVFPNGQNMLIDAGIDSFGPFLVDMLQAMGVEKLDYFVASHVHNDHVGGFPLLSEVIPIGQVLYSGHGLQNGDCYTPFVAALEIRAIPTQRLR